MTLISYWSQTRRSKESPMPSSKISNLLTCSTPRTFPRPDIWLVRLIADTMVAQSTVLSFKIRLTIKMKMTNNRNTMKVSLIFRKSFSATTIVSQVIQMTIWWLLKNHPDVKQTIWEQIPFKSHNLEAQDHNQFAATLWQITARQWPIEL